LLIHELSTNAGTLIGNLHSLVTFMCQCTDVDRRAQSESGGLKIQNDEDGDQDIEAMRTISKVSCLVMSFYVNFSAFWGLLTST
jgi:hypothetical protein